MALEMKGKKMSVVIIQYILSIIMHIPIRVVIGNNITNNNASIFDNSLYTTTTLQSDITNNQNQRTLLQSCSNIPATGNTETIIPTDDLTGYWDYPGEGTNNFTPGECAGIMTWAGGGQDVPTMRSGDNFENCSAVSQYCFSNTETNLINSIIFEFRYSWGYANMNSSNIYSYFRLAIVAQTSETTELWSWTSPAYNDAAYSWDICTGQRSCYSPVQLHQWNVSIDLTQAVDPHFEIFFINRNKNLHILPETLVIKIQWIVMTNYPTKYPTNIPTNNPSNNPATTTTTSQTPTSSPSNIPSMYPTINNSPIHSPTKNPTNSTTTMPSQTPTVSPSYQPTVTETTYSILVDTTLVTTFANENIRNSDHDVTLLILLVGAAIVMLCCCIFVWMFIKAVKKQTNENIHEFEEDTERSEPELPDKKISKLSVNSISNSIEMACPALQLAGSIVRNKGSDMDHRILSNVNTTAVHIINVNVAIGKDNVINVEVRNWLLNEVGLIEYYHNFVDYGYESLKKIKEISGVQDLKDIDIYSHIHQKRILFEIDKLWHAYLVNNNNEYLDGTAGIVDGNEPEMQQQVPNQLGEGLQVNDND